MTLDSSRSGCETKELPALINRNYRELFAIIFIDHLRLDLLISLLYPILTHLPIDIDADRPRLTEIPTPTL